MSRSKDEAKARACVKRGRAMRLSLGLCRLCPRQRAAGDPRYCYYHRVQARRYWRENYARRRDRGLAG